MLWQVVVNLAPGRSQNGMMRTNVGMTRNRGPGARENVSTSNHQIIPRIQDPSTCIFGMKNSITEFIRARGKKKGFKRTKNKSKFRVNDHTGFFFFGNKVLLAKIKDIFHFKTNPLNHIFW